MPTYQYACTDCGHRFEEVQAFSDPSLTVCPECGGKLRKVYGSVGVVFKGSGFYRNDSRAGKGKDALQPAGATGSGSGESGSGDGGSSTAGTEKSTPAAAKTGESSSSPSTPASAKKPTPASSGPSSPASSKAAAS